MEIERKTLRAERRRTRLESFFWRYFVDGFRYSNYEDRGEKAKRADNVLKIVGLLLSGEFWK